MSTNYEHNGEDDTLAARRTAHALGQTSGDDWAAVEAEMAASPQARQDVEASAAMAQRLKEAAETTPPAVRSPELRAAVEARLAKLEAAARPTVRGPVPQWRRRVVTWVLTAGCLAGVALAIMRQSNFFEAREPRQVAQTAGTPRMDASDARLNAAARLLVRGGPAKTSNNPKDQLPYLESSEVEPPATPQLDVDPTLHTPRVSAEEFQDDSRVFAHRGGGTVAGQNVTSPGYSAFGPGGPNVRGRGQGVASGEPSHWDMKDGQHMRGESGDGKNGEVARDADSLYNHKRFPREDQARQLGASRPSTVVEYGDASIHDALVEGARDAEGGKSSGGLTGGGEITNVGVGALTLSGSASLGGMPALERAEAEHARRYQETMKEQRDFLQKRSYSGPTDASGGTLAINGGEYGNLMSTTPGQVADNGPPLAFPDAERWKEMSRRRREKGAAGEASEPFDNASQRRDDADRYRRRYCAGLQL